MLTARVGKSLLPAAMFVALAVLSIPRLFAAPAEEGEKPAADYLQATDEAMRQWREARFGMFVCWGPVSLTGLEISWSRGAPEGGGRPGLMAGGGPTPYEVYDGLYKKWAPDKFDAREWVKVAKDTGMKYMIFLVKHHDGFSLYDTKLSDYRSTGPESAWKVDVMKEVADACHEAGLKLIVYYSQPDWHHPDYLTDNHDRYIEYLHGQIRELLTNYGRIDGLWFDNLRGVNAVPAAAKLWDAEKLFEMARELQPWLVINNRCGLPGDHETHEQFIGDLNRDRAWETCMTLGTQWSWKPDDNVKSLKYFIDVLVTCAGGDGNLAMNTNPMPNGEIEPRQAARFREIGVWMRKYGESIYGTRGGPFYGRPSVASTCKGNKIYIHVLKWDSDAIVLPPLDKKIVKTSVLTGGTATVKQSDDGIEIALPAAERDELDTIIVLELDGPAIEIAPLRWRSGSLAAGKKATASEFFQDQATYSPDKAFDDDPQTRWGCNSGTHACWLAVDLGEPKTFDRATLAEPYGRVQRFELQAKKNGKWQTFHTGTTIGDHLEVRFDPVTAQHVRLNIPETTEGPSIWEFRLFAVKD